MSDGRAEDTWAHDATDADPTLRLSGEIPLFFRRIPVS